MSYSSPTEYLKQLRLQRFYVNKFRVNYANANKLTPFIREYLKVLDDEIKEYETFVYRYKLNKQLEKYNGQITIYDVIRE